MALTNDDAQYWVTADAANNYAWKVANALPGTYTLTVYKGELEVYTASGGVVVTAGAGTALHTIACDDPEDDAAVWRIGEWDGTPKGFLNFGDTPMKPTYMHPVGDCSPFEDDPMLNVKYSPTLVCQAGTHPTSSSALQQPPTSQDVRHSVSMSIFPAYLLGIC